MRLRDYVKEKCAGHDPEKRSTEAFWEQIKEVLRKTPCSPADVANALGEKQTKVESAMQRMKKAGEIELVHYWKVREE